MTLASKAKMTPVHFRARRSARRSADLLLAGLDVRLRRPQVRAAAHQLVRRRVVDRQREVCLA